MEPTTGRIVHYQLSEADVAKIQSQRAEARIRWNNHSTGDVVPLLIVRVWPNEYGTGVFGVNGQAFLDGCDSLWVTSAKEGSESGQWSWPVVVR